MTDSDPRVFFAAERTLLAWVRTGLTIMAIGFVVARFDLFTHFLALQHQGELSPHPFAAFIGVAFTLGGSVAILLAALQHKRFVATMSPSDLPAGYFRSSATLLALIITGSGLMLAAYLLLT